MSSLILKIKSCSLTRQNLCNISQAADVLKHAYSAHSNPPAEIIASFKEFWQRDEDVRIFCNETWRIVDYLCIFLYVSKVQTDVTDEEDIETVFGGSGSIHYWKMWTSIFGIQFFKRSSKDLRSDNNQAVLRNFFRGSEATVENIRAFISLEYKNLSEMNKVEIKERVVEIM